MYEVVLKRFEQPDEVRNFERGKFELVHIGGMTVGRASYEPGWKWSLHVGTAAGAKSCMVEHVGLVISGRATGCHGRWTDYRDEARRSLLYCTGTRQLGGGKRTLCVAAFCGCE